MNLQSAASETSRPGGPSPLWLPLLIGLCQGGLFALTCNAMGEQYLAPLWTFVAVLGLFVQFTWNSPRPRAGLAAGAVLAAVWAACAWWVWWRLALDGFEGLNQDSRVYTFLPGLMVGQVVLLPFVQCWLEEGGRRFPYPCLFRNAWDGALILGVGALFTGGFWAVIALWAGLFSLLEVKFFGDVFFTQEFVLLSIPAAFGLGVAVGRERERVVNALKDIIFAMSRLLLPLLAGVFVLFLAAMLFTGLQPLWNTNHAAATLIGLQAALILFFNGVVQDQGRLPFGRGLALLTELALALMPVLFALSAVALWLRINQYGLTPDRVLAVLSCGVLGLYGLGYAVAVAMRRLARRPDLRPLEPVNKALAWLGVAVLLAVHTPLLDPLRLAAESQCQRLLSGVTDPAEFDYHSLYTQYDDYGRKRFLRIQEDAKSGTAQGLSAEQVETMLRNMDDVVQTSRPVAGPIELGDPDIRFVNLHGPEPEGLRRAVMERMRGRYAVSTLTLVVEHQMDEYAPMEYLAFLDYVGGEFHLFDQDAAGAWRAVGVYYGGGSLSEVEKALENSALYPVPQGYRDLQVGAFRLPLQPGF